MVLPTLTPVTDPLLRVRDIAIEYGTSSLFGRRPTRVVEDVSFDIGRGQTLGLVGESGSGKSTTGRAILRLLPIAEGTIEVDGVDISSYGARTPLGYRKQVQAVFQDPSMSLNPKRPAAFALTEALARHGISDRRERARVTQDAFDQVGLQRAHLERYPTELSGGQQQRVAIARALVLKPQLVVCDEAVSALDLSTQSQIINLLVDLQQETGVSYLFIAHDLGIVRHISDRIAVMRSGRIVEIADADDLFERPEHPYTKRLLGATPADHPRGREERRLTRVAYAHAIADGVVPLP
ncbi:ATP-binding cassette domain-containing protein [Microbacterium sp. A204]|uniref:ATP-binding cassette domain-containing protein n=1 Tax=Microbacterium sp. A204 TaxID=3457321 RepID=UPI003FD653E0